ncbi:MAG TPA: hypothetical protein VGH20_01450 [Myxococcales bacterium]|jgi:hypothetical protein
MRRVLAFIALVTVLATPGAARTRFFCHYTGIEILDCAEQRIPARDVLDRAACCDVRVIGWSQPALHAQADAVAPPFALVAAPLMVAPLPAPLPRVVAARNDTRAAGPPLFVVQRAFLI